MSVPVTSTVNDPPQLVDVVQLTVNNLSQSEVGNSVDEEPPLKRMRVGDDEVSTEMSVKQILFNINKAICLRLDSIENKLDNLTTRNKQLEEKVDQLSAQVKASGNVLLSQAKGTPTNKKSGAVIVGLPQARDQAEFDGACDMDSNSSVDGIGQSIQNLGPNVQLITLNTEEDFPLGVWLGDEGNPEMRVRVPITPSDLLHIHSNCRTPEKMALTLLDYLFDRETQASSNLSGLGKHSKKQLDPLMIYGIRCHLISRFSVSEQEWSRIKLNIDSKCRTAHRRRTKGLPLTVKSFRGRSQPEYVHSSETLGQSHVDLIQPDDLTEGELHIQQDGVDLSAAEVMHSTAAEALLQSNGGQIQVIQATPEQVAQLQQAHQIQILQADATQVIAGLQHGDGTEPLQVSVSLAQSPDGSIQVINTEDGDTMHISAEALKSEPNEDSDQ